MKHRVWLVSALLLGTACTTTDIVYRTRPPFNPPPDSASGFLGYFTASTKQTTCGNCHVEKQAAWVTTNHAHAWADLQASGHAAAYCSNCHSVSQNGNSYGKPGGYAVKADSAYLDVQCENCHGPGSDHLKDPQGRFIQKQVPETVCLHCHETANSPQFDDAKYRPFIVGPGHGKPLPKGETPHPLSGGPHEQ